MKNLLLLVTFLVLACGLSAQSAKGRQSVVFNTGYQSDFERFQLGAQYRYVFHPKFRVAPDFMFFFPKDHTTGLDLNLNAHYVVDIDKALSIYPLAGIAMQNNRYKYNDGIHNKSFGLTDFGFNLGAGLSYNFGKRYFFNSEMKYMISDYDCFIFSLGVGFHL